jgi:hypothetical protein
VCLDHPIDFPRWDKRTVPANPDDPIRVEFYRRFVVALQKILFRTGEVPPTPAFTELRDSVVFRPIPVTNDGAVRSLASLLSQFDPLDEVTVPDGEHGLPRKPCGAHPDPDLYVRGHVSDAMWQLHL